MYPYYDEICRAYQSSGGDSDPRNPGRFVATPATSGRGRRSRRSQPVTPASAIATPAQLEGRALAAPVAAAAAAAATAAATIATTVSAATTSSSCSTRRYRIRA